MSTTCRDCGVEIMWLKHKDTGKSAPIGVAKSSDGNIVVNPDKTLYRIANGEEYGKNRMAESPSLHLSHFARCPAAKEFRKKK